VRHRDHHAWYQRAFVPGDFFPGRPRVHGRYTVSADGRYSEPTAVVLCETCGEDPALEHMQAIDVVSGRVAWPPPPSDLEACWMCGAGRPGPGALCAGCLANSQRPEVN
jgi:hypothetical protein